MPEDSEVAREQRQMGALLEHFAALEDPRVERARLHSLLALVTSALCGVICGAERWGEIAEFGRIKADWFATFLDLPHGIPSHDTFGRVFAHLDAAQFEAGFAAWMQAVAEGLPVTAVQPVSLDAEPAGADVIALDGKTLRRSHDRGAGKEALHLVSAWASANRLGDRPRSPWRTSPTRSPLSRSSCGNWSSQAVWSPVMRWAARPPLPPRSASRRRTTCWRSRRTSRSCTRRSRTALPWPAPVASLTPPPDTWSHWRPVGKGHGRLEVREHWVLSDPAVVASLREQVVDWPGLQALGLVEAQRHFPDGHTTRQTRSSLLSTPLSAEHFGQAVRRHWGIENQVHWLLDVAFSEEDSRVRLGEGAENFAVLRRLALHLLKQETTTRTGIKGKRLKAGWSDAYLLKILLG